jgi:pimeloyl-ACP methyl ester carboxylesterase
MLQTRADRAVEALAAARCLASQDRVRPNAVGILGISEGAMVTLFAAARDESIAFAIPVSGAFGVPMLEQARYRIEVMGLARGMNQDDLQKALLLEELLFALLVGPDRFEWRLIEMKAAQWPDEPWLAVIDGARNMKAAATIEQRQEYWSQLTEALRFWRSEPWFKLVVVDVDRFDRLTALSAAQFSILLDHGPLAAGDFAKVSHELRAYPNVRCSVLAIWGSKDEYLPPNRSSSFLRMCLCDAGNTDATYRIVPDASHILTVPGSDEQFI